MGCIDRKTYINTLKFTGIMKTKKILALLLMSFSIQLLASCTKTEADNLKSEITSDDRQNLLFMLEEEKLARDTYIYLNNLYQVNQFSNIQQSEQRHMDAIAGLLDSQGIEYTILPEGQFSDATLQNLYNSFVEEGKKGIVEAYKIGATIEDVDIFDLTEKTAATTNESIIAVFDNLKCGSGNHMRSFCAALESNGVEYTAQFISPEELETILAGTNGGCGNGKGYGNGKK